MSGPRPFDVAEVLRHLSPGLPPALVRPEVLGPIERFAAELPPVWNWGMLECRLAPDDHVVDLLTCCSDVGEARARMAASLDAGALGFCVEDTRRQVEAWVRPPPAGPDSPQLWFEWDRLDREDNDPLVWWGADPGFFTSDGSASDGALAEACLALQLGDIGAYRPSIRAAVEALPDGGRLLGIGSLGPRGRAAIRLFVQLPWHRLRPWLSTIGWPGDLDAVHADAARARSPQQPLFVQVECGPAVGPYLGLEVQQTVAGFPSRPDRRDWLRWMEGQGLATPDKCGAVLRWPGQEPMADGGILHRSFHLKLARQPEGLVAKAYLGFAVLEGG